jgi:gliding motility-associated-like protein
MSIFCFTKIGNFLIRIKLIVICSLFGITSLRAQVPVTDFSASTVAGCGPLSVKFTDQSTNKPTAWAWDFGNGQISSAQNPTIIYTTAGTYTVILITKNSSGSSSITKTDYISVFPFPTPDFKANLQTACVPATVQFTDLSTPGQGAITKWDWDFGDGGTSNASGPSHLFPQTGYYNIKLTVTNAGGCAKDVTFYRYVRVVSGVQPDFTWTQTSASCSAPFNITFNNQTSGPGTLTYEWDLATGTSSATNPSTTYPSDIPYTIKLKATSDLGCSGTTSKTVSFKGNPPVITAPDSACLNTPVSFLNGSSPAPVSSSWNFGDGATSGVTNPSKTYTALGTYTVTLTNTNTSCTASASKSIKIINSQPITFTADNTGTCKTPFTVNFQDQTPASTSWLWNFGDGSTSTEKDPSHTYNSPGAFDVTLSSSSSGCSGTSTTPQYIRISPPSIAYKPASAQGCSDGYAPELTIDAPDGVASYSWNSGGGSPATSTSATPTFKYPSVNADYNISVTVTTNAGCAQTLQWTAKIGTRTTSSFTASPKDQCVHQPITFSTSATPADSYRWGFGDLSTGNFVGSTIQHSYKDTGYFNITLILTNYGCTDIHNELKYVHISAPLAGFKYDINCTDRHKVAITDTSQLDPAKGAATYRWIFDDGSPDEFTKNPIAPHTFPDLNPKKVILIVSQGGCTDTTNTTITLQALIPAFSINPAAVCKNIPFTLSSPTLPLSAIDSFTWTVNKVTRITKDPTFSTTIPDTGLHTISLVITDMGGCVYPAVTHDVLITGPKAAFTPAVGGCRNSPITFTDNSTPFRTDALKSWYFDFGDGKTQTYTAPPFTHLFADTGTYPILLAIMDVNNCVDTVTLPAATKITAPKAGFLARDTLYCPNAPLSFLDSSKGNNLTYSWNFGDGTPPSTDQNPTHTFTGNGQYYTVRLEITDATGCADSVIQTKYIHIQKPIASFLLEDSVGICRPLQALFTPTGKYYDSLYWNFGDGTTSNLDTTAHFYNDYGVDTKNYAFQVMLILQGDGGCRDTATRNVYLYKPDDPGFPFEFTPKSACDSVPASFTFTPPPYTSYSVFFGDGAVDSSGSQTPTHTYHDLGTYNPQLALSDASGCIVGRNNGSVKVLGAVPIYSPDKRDLCDAGTVNFQGIVISNDGQTSLTWDFGDGTPPLTDPTPTGTPSDPFLSQSHTYTQPGLRLASLKVTTNSGCNDTYIDSVHIWQTPHPLISTDGSLCTGLIQFRGGLTTPDADSVSWSWTFSQGAASTAKDPLLRFVSGPLTAHLKTSVDFGCNDTISQTVLILPLPEIKGPKVITTPVGIPVTLPFTYSSNVNTYQWSPASYLDCTDCPNPAATPTFNTTYSIKVTDDNNCVSLDTVLVKTICGGENYFIPNTFSPNRDGVNDVFYPRGKGLHNIQSMRVFNRWGQLVFERKDFPANAESQGWDGTVNGRPAPSDAYIYIVEVICINAQVIALKGDITLLR